MLWNFISFCPKNLPYQKNMIPQQKIWSGCYCLLPPTQKRSEFGPWQSLSRDVLGQEQIFINLGPQMAK